MIWDLSGERLGSCWPRFFISVIFIVKCGVIREIVKIRLSHLL
ncbi:hypothetical protein Hdeb2414_s0005g00158441 [Helianthus debilis subsp. tardiflorus]